MSESKGPIMDWELFRLRLIEARTKSGLTQRGLGKAVLRTGVEISDLESPSGRRSPGVLELLRGICLETGTSADYLLGLSESSKANRPLIVRMKTEEANEIGRMVDGLDRDQREQALALISALCQLYDEGDAGDILVGKLFEFTISLIDGGSVANGDPAAGSFLFAAPRRFTLSGGECLAENLF